TTAAPTTTAPANPQSGDRITINVSGHYNYAADVAVSGPGYSVASDANGPTSVTGFGTFPGRTGGTASAAVNVSKFLWWSFGSIAVNDPGAGLNNIEAPILFGPGISGSKAAASVGASWFGWNNGFVGYSINVTVADNG
ncbi:MAG: hypothetical protein GX868_12140, partial [Actinobacteria bacterium]|nr:hypothetical protein [Actinomycetota bacterium]